MLCWTFILFLHALTLHMSCSHTHGLLMTRSRVLVPTPWSLYDILGWQPVTVSKSQQAHVPSCAAHVGRALGERFVSQGLFATASCARSTGWCWRLADCCQHVNIQLFKDQLLKYQLLVAIKKNGFQRVYSQLVSKGSTSYCLMVIPSLRQHLYLHTLSCAREQWAQNACGGDRL